MINAYLTDNITIKTATVDKWGTKTFSSATTRGRIEFRTKLVRNLQGEQVVSTAKVYLPPTSTVSYKDVIRYNSVDYTILGIQHAKDFSTKFIKLDLA